MEEDLLDRELANKFYDFAENHWDQIATFGYAKFLEVGRGVVYLHIKDLTEDNGRSGSGMLPIRYITAADESLQDYVSEELRPMVDEYDVHNQLMFCIQDNEAIYVGPYGMAYLEAPQDVYLRTFQPDQKPS